MTATKPGVRPTTPHFSSGPCAKRPGWSLQTLTDAVLGRSHRSKAGRAKLKRAIDLTREVLEVPADYRIGIVPASDTGAVEMALWSLLGARPVTMLAWESFGEGWVTDVKKQLKLKDVTVINAPYGELPDLGKVDFSNDVVFTWNGTTSGVRVPNGDWIASGRQGLTICDATSAAFAQRLDWPKLDVVTFSWQKALGGEGAHGMLILSPHAVERVETYKPAWPLPKIFRLTKGGKLNEGVFAGETINTPSMLCVEDYLDALQWAKSLGGLSATVARSDANAKALSDWVAVTPWVGHLAKNPRERSNTSVCLKVVDTAVVRLSGDDQAAFAKTLAGLLEKEGVAYDIAYYRDAPPGLRIWCGTTVERNDIEALTPWLDGLAIRSATKVTAKILEQAKDLKVIGRAGIGVDNVDIPAATARGIIVMNTPFGNSITTAEHTISLMLALARQIPEADASTRAGKWEKNKFMGVEMFSKTLGVIGCGNIGSIVADRALGLKMKVIAYDPFLAPERATDLGVEKVELDELFRRADFITLHTPLTDKTRNVISAAAIKTMKKGVRIVNCARGGLVEEGALYEALKNGRVAGAAFDVFVTEPATENPLFNLPNVVCTPHLGASTSEAQENVALQIAEQMSDYLLRGAITNAINFPSISAEEAPRLKPFIALAERLGSFAGQLTETGVSKVQLVYEGAVAQMNTKALTSAALAGLLRPMLGDVNVVSAPVVAKERGIVVEEVTREMPEDYESLITVTVTTERQSRHVSGTVFADGRPRIVNIKGIRMDAEFGPSMIYITNLDKPGFIGKFSSTLGEAGINIATFHVGRDAPGGNAVALIEIDGELPESVLAQVRALPQVQSAKPLRF